MFSRLFKNIWLKISALLLAVLTWWGVHNSMETSEDLIYRVRLNLPPNINAKDISPSQFVVRVSGPNEAVKAFRAANHEYLIDLSTFKGDEATIQVIEINRSAIEIPLSMSIQDIPNPKIRITLDPLIQKELRVECNITDKPAPGYLLTGKLVRPSRITRVLPSKDAKTITKIWTVPITVSAATTSIIDRVALIDPLDPSRTLDDFVDVIITIEPDLAEKSFKDIPVLVLHSPEDKREVILDSVKISVTLQGRRDIIETLDKSKLLVFLDITKQEAGEYDLQPSIQPLEGISFTKKDSVKYTIKP
jgi:hypothetical protein